MDYFKLYGALSRMQEQTTTNDTAVPAEHPFDTPTDEWVKCCPNCGLANSSRAAVCRECLTSLSGVEPISENRMIEQKIEPFAAELEKREQRRRLFERLRPAILGVCVLLILFSIGASIFFAGWWGVGAVACFAAAGWNIYKPESYYEIWWMYLDDRGNPVPAYYFRLYSMIASFIVAGFALLFVGILRN